MPLFLAGTVVGCKNGCFIHYSFPYQYCMSEEGNQRFAQEVAIAAAKQHVQGGQCQL